MKSLSERIDAMSMDEFSKFIGGDVSPPKRREFVSFKVYIDENGSLCMIVYNNHEHDFISQIYTGYEKHEKGTLSNHIITLYQDDYEECAKHYWNYHLTTLCEREGCYFDMLEMYNTINMYDVVVDEYGVYQHNFETHSGFEFYRDNLKKVVDVIFND